MYPIHPACLFFPEMEREEYDALKADIAKHGQLEPIVLDGENQIIDGRHRYKVCQELGIEPRKKRYSGSQSVLDFVVSTNLHRRHLTSGQRAILAAELLPEFEKEARQRQGARNDITQKIAEGSQGEAREKASGVFNTNRQYVSNAKTLLTEAPKLAQEVKQGTKTISSAIKEHKKQVKAEAKAVVPELPNIEERYALHLCSVSELASHVAPDSLDCIITDPPYPQQYLHVYSELSAFAAKALKPGSSLLCMVGQSYLPEIISRLSEHLTYHWTLAYLTPGGQSAQLWQRNVNTFWKPVLWFTKGKYQGDWNGDVVQSKPNGNDKEHHEWGQSVSGMLELVERFSYPGELICDPFLGGGTTAYVALKTNRTFVGCDISEKAVSTSRKRIEVLYANG